MENNQPPQHNNAKSGDKNRSNKSHHRHRNRHHRQANQQVDGDAPLDAAALGELPTADPAIATTTPPPTNKPPRDRENRNERTERNEQRQHNDNREQRKNNDATKGSDQRAAHKAVKQRSLPPPAEMRPDLDPNEQWAMDSQEAAALPAVDTTDTDDGAATDATTDQQHALPRIAISIGDLNGIGIEVILKTFAHPQMAKLCIPIVYGSAKAIAHHRQQLGLVQVAVNVIRQPNRARAHTLNVINCWDDEPLINIGQADPQMGYYAHQALGSATDDLLNGYVDALVTAPVNKNLLHTDDTPFKGHTEYLTDRTQAPESLMLLVADQLKVGLVTNHLPLKDVAKHITPANILTKLRIMDQSLRKDFGIDRPKIAVLALNPHAGDGGLIGIEEQATIMPAIEHAKRQENILAFGPYPADGFFGSQQYAQFDAVLAMYHDQGLIPFKALSFGQGVNFTAGLPIVRTSPDHGTAYNIAGQGMAAAESLQHAIYRAIDIRKNRQNYHDMRANPLRKVSANMRELAAAEDEAIAD